jgi:hypothetical protein
MKIYRPIKTNWLTQAFGENKPCAKLDANGNAIRPFQIVTGGATCPIGYAKFYPLINLAGHNGEDWWAYHGEPLYFPVDSAEAGGWHSAEASDLDGGLGLDVISNKPVMGDRYVKFRFWHLKEAWKDQDVRFGELIGYCDNTGASSGDHLHWSMKWCDKDGNHLDEGNGYAGASDFRPWFENTFVLDILGVKEKAKTAIDLAWKVIADVKLFIDSWSKLQTKK